ncbi:MAG TPA: hypothetical protein VM620_03880 [Hyphomicrobium sp.]|jgi:hypothetical protein|nr:hypothetical protein [Hyphomicrobium sp.]
MSIDTAIKAAQENMDRYVSSEKDPAQYNISVALRNIAEAVKKLQRDIDIVKAGMK